MKKLMLISSLIFSLVFLRSCADKNVAVKPIVKPSEQNTVPQGTKVQPTIKDFFFYKENIISSSETILEKILWLMSGKMIILFEYSWVKNKTLPSCGLL